MKNLIKLCLFSALLTAPAYAQTGKGTAMADCPGKAQMGDMQKSMGALLGDSESIMKMMKDPAQLARMQKMHDQMGAMMVNMQKMNGMSGMMGGGMMGGSMMRSGKPATPPADDHGARHPDK
jgi:hypothetical protein